LPSVGGRPYGIAVETRTAVVARHLLLLLIGLGLGVAALATVLPGIPHGGVTANFLAIVALGLITDAVDLIRGERPNVAVRGFDAVPVSAGLALGAYAFSWLARSPAPLAWFGGLLVSIGLGALVALVLGRADRTRTPVPSRPFLRL
jgi:hypothetical protein